MLNALLAAGMREIAGKIHRDGERQAFWKGTSHHAPPARGAHRKAARLLPPPLLPALSVDLVGVILGSGNVAAFAAEALNAASLKKGGGSDETVGASV